MIIACPACATRYVVPDSAIGVDGRTVRCAKCRHSWFQHGPELPQRPEPVPVAAPPPAQASAEPAAQAAAPEADAASEAVPSGTEAEPPPPIPEEPRIQQVYSDETTAEDFSYSSFAHEPPFRPRRNRLKLYTIAASVFAVIAFAAIGAVAWYGLPDWAPLARQTFASAQPDLVLEFPPNRQDRRTLPNGAEFFGASGKVTNVGKERRNVPPILIVLRDSADRIVYSWEVFPPKRQLAPGESMTINEAVTDVPRSAKFAEIGWKPG
ncbi:zinc-ribbon domain-containing protein [Novosphingobium flavum]|uniref:Zinc-ribbon domain-containing protein n=1 Tax=Novosphingobium flavum TaxID=1778672 RepID=A0A7X1FUI2_9SPHN|nr:zinc-ribbon domain-containing protein [Novosphingobium flavum]MBC2667203.1 zinc-ribbon domain-containing protein [Novosphingobium flavum]